MLAADNQAASPQSDSATIVATTIQRCSQFATLPTVAVQIIRITEDPHSTIDDLKRVISQDPVLGVRILKLVNSSFYGMTGQVASIDRALNLLGLRAVKSIAIAVSLTKLFRGGTVGVNFDPAQLWTHSIAVATGARILAAHSELVPCDEAFLAGLIHDLGILIEIQSNAQKFLQLTRRIAADESLAFRQGEIETFGASHEEFGASLCENWNFPRRLQLATGYHHRPWELSEADRPLPAIVHIADVISARLALGYSRTVETAFIDPAMLDAANLTESMIGEITDDLSDVMRQSASMFA